MACPPRKSPCSPGWSIKPDTDIDKVAAYWGNIPNVRCTDIRPLMEALKALPGPAPGARSVAPAPEFGLRCLLCVLAPAWSFFALVAPFGDNCFGMATT